MRRQDPKDETCDLGQANFEALAASLVELPAHLRHLPQAMQILHARRLTERREIDDRKEKEDKQQLARAQAIAAWEAKKVLVGNVEMTNAEHLRALRAVNENVDYHADWSVRKGLICRFQPTRAVQRHRKTAVQTQTDGA